MLPLPQSSLLALYSLNMDFPNTSSVLFSNSIIVGQAKPASLSRTTAKTLQRIPELHKLFHMYSHSPFILSYCCQNDLSNMHIYNVTPPFQPLPEILTGLMWLECLHGISLSTSIWSHSTLLFTFHFKPQNSFQFLKMYLLWSLIPFHHFFKEAFPECPKFPQCPSPLTVSPCNIVHLYIITLTIVLKYTFIWVIIWLASSFPIGLVPPWGEEPCCYTQHFVSIPYRDLAYSKYLIHFQRRSKRNKWILEPN